MPKVYKLRKEQLHATTLTDDELQLVEKKRQGYFHITSVHRDDLKQAGFKIGKISDHTMIKLADKMADDYCNQLFWSSLKILAEELGIKKRKKQ